MPSAKFLLACVALPAVACSTGSGSEVSGSLDAWVSDICTAGTYTTPENLGLMPAATTSGTCVDKARTGDVLFGTYRSETEMNKDVPAFSSYAVGLQQGTVVVFAVKIGTPNSDALQPLTTYGFHVT